MKTIIIDNYDSFTYNLAQQIAEITGKKPVVTRNDAIQLKDIKAFDRIVLSPGPGIPEEAGLLKEVIGTYASTKSILGICLGMQAIAEVFDTPLRNLSTVYHGVRSDITILNSDERLFKGMNSPIEVGRYHSWVVDRAKLSEDLVVTAIDTEGEIMALRHRKYDVQGVQFHPESILTPKGMTIMKNALLPFDRASGDYIPDTNRYDGLMNQKTSRGGC
jgi:anthranilate synthase component 2